MSRPDRPEPLGAQSAQTTDMRKARAEKFRCHRSTHAGYDYYCSVPASELGEMARDVLALVAQVDALTQQRQEMHRRAQEAEGALARKPDLAVLGETLEQLKTVKSDRHRLRNELAFKVREVARLHASLGRAASTLRENDRADTVNGIDVSFGMTPVESAYVARLRGAVQAALDELSRVGASGRVSSVVSAEARPHPPTEEGNT